MPQMLQRKDLVCERIEVLLTPVKETPPVVKDTPTLSPPPKKIIKPYNRQIIFPAKRLESESDIDAYVEKVREQLKILLRNCDGIQLK